MLSFEGFRAYARLDDPVFDEGGEQETARLCYEAAMADAESCGIPVEKLRGNAKFALYIYALAGHYFDNRAFLSASQSYTGDEYAKRMMTKMQLELKAEGWEENGV